MLQVFGKGQKERWVPLGAEAEHWLNVYLSDVRPRMLKPGIQTNKVFLNNRGNGLSRKGMWKNFKAIAEEAGVFRKNPYPPSLVRHPFTAGRSRFEECSGDAGAFGHQYNTDLYSP